jgi:hypothetical protein
MWLFVINTSSTANGKWNPNMTNHVNDMLIKG